MAPKSREEKLLNFECFSMIQRYTFVYMLRKCYFMKNFLKFECAASTQLLRFLTNIFSRHIYFNALPESESTRSKENIRKQKLPFPCTRRNTWMNTNNNNQDEGNERATTKTMTTATKKSQSNNYNTMVCITDTKQITIFAYTH